MKAGDGLVVLLELAGDQTHEVVRVRIGGQQLGGARERGQRRVGVAEALLQQAQVVPRAHVAIVSLHCGLEDLLRGLVPLQREQRDGLVHRRRRQALVARGRVLEVLQRDLELLLVHRRHAEVVQAHGVSNRGYRRRRLAACQENRQRQRNNCNPTQHVVDYVRSRH